MEIVEERVLLKDLPLVDVHTRDGPVIGALLVVRIKQTLKALSPAWTASATPSQVLPMEPGYDLEAGVINKPTVLCSAGHALLEDILCLQELQKQHPWFETMISEIQKVRPIKPCLRDVQLAKIAFSPPHYHYLSGSLFYAESCGHNPT